MMEIANVLTWSQL